MCCSGGESMNGKNTVSWFPEIESNIDSRVVNYLNQHHEEYQALREVSREIEEKHADLFHRIETEAGKITLTAKELQAYVDYQQIRFAYEGIERQYFYLFGQADWITYTRLLEELSQETLEHRE